MPFFEKDYRKYRSSVEQDFEELCGRIYEYQMQNCSIFKDWAKKSPKLTLDNAPFDYSFLPISFFKNHILSSVPEFQFQKIYKSSGTTSSTPSQLALYRPEWYRANTIALFEDYFGSSPADYRILALLPSYLDGRESSLVDMVKDWMSLSPSPYHGFYMHDTSALIEELKKPEKTLLIGVSFAMIELADHIDFPLQDCIIIETGGMKGKGSEWTKSELLEYLERGFGQKVYSEYGMTELTSQCYKYQDQAFKCSPGMRFFVRDETDPTVLHSHGRGGLCIIDLANMDTVSFIATDDLASLNEDGSFEILGRLNNADVRGCSQMYFE